MDDKRTIIAIVLSIVILLSWQHIAVWMGWMQPKNVEQTQQTKAPVASPEAVVSTAPPTLKPETPVAKFVPGPGRELSVETPLYSAMIHTSGGILHSFVLKNYKNDLSERSEQVNLVSPETATTSPMGITVNGQASWSVGTWASDGENVNLSAGESKSLTFTGLVEGVRVTRVLTFHADSYLISENLRIAPSDNAQHPVRLGFIVASSPFTGGKYDPTRLAWDDNGSFEDETSADTLTKTGILENGNFAWAGIMSNYFMNIVSLSEPYNLTLKGRIQGEVWRAGLERPEFLVPESGEVPFNVHWWFGPKDREMLDKAPGGMTNAIHYGIFSFIARPLLAVLSFFHKFVGNWGIAIIMLTCCIRIFFWPLSQKSYKSMQQMKKLQPMVAKLKEKYGNDKQAMSRELMQLYRTYKVNPAGGCLPIVVQIPVFIGLYQALLNSIDLRHAAFISHIPFTDIVWLADLSAADPFYITPVLMGATMFLQQWITPAAGDPTQQKVMMVMPLVFFFMFLNFPAGLVLYWLSNNILSVIQQWWILRKA